MGAWNLQLFSIFNVFKVKTSEADVIQKSLEIQMHSMSEEDHSKRLLHMTIYKAEERTVQVNLEMQVVSGYAWCQTGFGRQTTFGLGE